MRRLRKKTVIIVLAIALSLSLLIAGVVTYAEFTDSKHAQRTIATYESTGDKFSSNYLNKNIANKNVREVYTTDEDIPANALFTLCNYEQGKQIYPFGENFTYVMTVKLVKYSDESYENNIDSSDVTALNRIFYRAYNSSTDGSATKYTITVTEDNDGVYDSESNYISLGNNSAGATARVGGTYYRAYNSSTDGAERKYTITLARDIDGEYSAAHNYVAVSTATTDYIVSSGRTFYRAYNSSTDGSATKYTITVTEDNDGVYDSNNYISLGHNSAGATARVGGTYYRAYNSSTDGAKQKYTIALTADTDGEYSAENNYVAVSTETTAFIDLSHKATVSISGSDPVTLSSDNIDDLFEGSFTANDWEAKSYLISFSEAFVKNYDSDLCVEVEAVPSSTSLPTLRAIFKPTMRAAGASNAWTGHFTDSSTPAPSAYDGFNYRIEGVGSGAVTLTWDDTKVGLNYVSEKMLSDIEGAEKTSNSITFPVDSNVTSVYDLQFYKKQPQDTKWSWEGMTWSDMSESVVTVRFE